MIYFKRNPKSYTLATHQSTGFKKVTDASFPADLDLAQCRFRYRVSSYYNSRWTTYTISAKAREELAELGITTLQQLFTTASVSPEQEKKLRKVVNTFHCRSGIETTATYFAAAKDCFTGEGLTLPWTCAISVSIRVPDGLLKMNQLSKNALQTIIDKAKVAANEDFNNSVKNLDRILAEEAVEKAKKELEDLQLKDKEIQKKRQNTQKSLNILLTALQELAT